MLGEGGEGSVGLGVHRDTRGLWALKEIRTADEDALHEAAVLRGLHHAALPEIVDVLQVRGGIVLVMEYVRGTDLETYIRRNGPMREQDLLTLFAELSDALLYLHSRRPPILHLDIKPANILLRPDGQVVLTDFGASWRQSGPGGRMPAWRRKGTDGYAAPEQYDPDGLPDERTDQYALGAVLFFASTGKRPDPSRPAGRQELPGGSVSVLILRCLRERAEDRFPGTAELAAQLRKLARRKKREKRRIRVYAAILLVLFSGALALRGIRGRFERTEGESWNYEQLLKEAACLPLPEAGELYGRAVFLQPERETAYLQLLDQALSDGLYTSGEEKIVRTILHAPVPGGAGTYEEQFSKNREGYGLFCFRLGLACWYDSPGSEARWMADGWLAKAEDSLAADGDTVSFAHLLSFYRDLTTESAALYAENEEGTVRDERFFDGLERLLEDREEEVLTERRRQQFYLDSLHRVLSRLAILREAGVADARIARYAHLVLRREEEMERTEGAGWQTDEAAEKGRQIRKMGETLLGLLPEAVREETKGEHETE